MSKKILCPQPRCVFNQFGGCRACSVCKCEANLIDENCDKCWNCAYDQGILRWNDNDETQDQKQEELKPIEVKA